MKRIASKAPVNPFAFRKPADSALAMKPLVHVYGKGAICGTDKRGHATPKGRSPLELVVDASEGFIPLWAKGTKLYWRFQERAMSNFQDPEAAQARIRELLGKALLKWGSFTPVKFVERDNPWDFEVVPKRNDDCDANGCTLAMAFFPDGGQHELVMYPRMFQESEKEQVETLVHEFGHVFGLRHFFAQVSERTWRSEVFGKHVPFTIMNYGDKSRLTAADKKDLKTLYRKAWSGQLEQINGTPIRLVRPYSTLGDAAR